ncbi:Uncharacterised protein [Pseudomonas aeruginosa]|nr:Uncharacterised protein [Pseudomonas aeruginosa]
MRTPHGGPDKVFIQTGTEYVGQRETWVGVGGQGVAGMAPVSSEAVYRKTGYYENETILDYFCSITLYTDSRDIITNASVIGLPGQPLTGPPGPGLPSRRRTPDAEALRTMALRYRFLFP